MRVSGFHRGLILESALFLFLAWNAEALRALEEPADFSSVPGIVIDHLPAAAKQFIGSPSIAILPEGDYVASHDLFGEGSTHQRTQVFGSSDGGRTWTKRADIDGQWWSSLFVHRGALYLMGTSREYGSAVIRRSIDKGRTWTVPQDAGTGLLLGEGKYHCAPGPVVEHAGRVWRAMEDAMGPGGWGSHFRAFMMSAPADADLLSATNWTCSNRLERDPAWLGGKFGGWLEGNAVVALDGQIVDVLRVHSSLPAEQAAIVHVSATGLKASFDPASDFIRFPGGAKKFSIRRDPLGKWYWSLSNEVPTEDQSDHPDRVRNTLSLIRSSNLRDWEVRVGLLHHPDPIRHGFQYADWQFDGSDLVAVVRTAFDDGLGGARNQHDANFLTFHRIKDFRQMTQK